MSEILKANVFFFITGTAVIILTVIVAVILAYLIVLMRRMREILDDVKDITAKARTEEAFISQDMADLRARVKTEGAKLTHLVTFFRSLIGRRRLLGKRSKRSSAEDDEK